MLYSWFVYALGIAVALGVPAWTAAAQEGTASMIGRVINRETRVPIRGASVMLAATGVATLSDSAGQYRYGGLAPGSHLFEVNAVGYEKSLWRVRLDTGEQERVFELDLLRYELPGVEVAAPRVLTEFERRRGHGSGFFFTQEEIERRHATSLSDLMRGVPGVHTTCRRGSCAIQMSRSPRVCRPDYYLDGFPSSYSVGADFPLRGIYGIEVYRGPSETPVEFRKPEQRCGVILIWSRAEP